VFDYYRRGYSTVHVRDLRNALLAVYAANSRAMQLSTSRDAEIFQQGFIAALEAVATSFGLGPLLEHSGVEHAQVGLLTIGDIT